MSPGRKDRATRSHSACWDSGVPGASGSRGGGTGAGRPPGLGRPDGSSATSAASTRIAIRNGTRSYSAAPTLAAVAPISMVRRRVICWVKNPLFRSVNSTPARIRTGASSTVSRAVSARRAAGGAAGRGWRGAGWWRWRCGRRVHEEAEVPGLRGPPLACWQAVSGCYPSNPSNSPFRTPPTNACHSSGVNRSIGPAVSLLLRMPISPSGRLATSTQLPLAKLRELLTQ